MRKKPEHLIAKSVASISSFLENMLIMLGRMLIILLGFAVISFMFAYPVIAALISLFFGSPPINESIQLLESLGGLLIILALFTLLYIASFYILMSRYPKLLSDLAVGLICFNKGISVDNMTLDEGKPTHSGLFLAIPEETPELQDSSHIREAEEFSEDVVIPILANVSLAILVSNLLSLGGHPTDTLYIIIALGFLIPFPAILFQLVRVVEKSPITFYDHKKKSISPVAANVKNKIFQLSILLIIVELTFEIKGGAFLGLAPEDYHPLISAIFLLGTFSMFYGLITLYAWKKRKKWIENFRKLLEKDYGFRQLESKIESEGKGEIIFQPAQNS